MTASATGKANFLHTVNARILSLIIAIAVAAAGFLLFDKDFGKPLIKADVPGGASAILQPYAQRPAVDDCRAKRLAEIDKLAQDGFLSEEDANTARSRAVTMCSERN